MSKESAIHRDLIDVVRWDAADLIRERLLPDARDEFVATPGDEGLPLVSGCHGQRPDMWLILPEGRALPVEVGQSHDGRWFECIRVPKTARGSAWYEGTNRDDSIQIVIGCINRALSRFWGRRP